MRRPSRQRCSCSAAGAARGRLLLRRIYLDTSLLRATAMADLPLDDHGAGLAALALLVRRGAIAPEESQEAWKPRILRLLPLRAGDPLHLVLCERLTLQLASFTRGLCKAAADHQVAHAQLLI